MGKSTRYKYYQPNEKDLKGKRMADGTPKKYRERYEKQAARGFIDVNMEYKKSSDVKNGSWVLITRQVPVEEKCKPHLFGIYWGVPKQDTYDRQICVIHTTEDVTLLNHEYTVIDEERLQVYREEGWELHETHAKADRGMDMELIEKGRALCEEERETIWALQLDGLTEGQACEEYFLARHTDYNNFNICYIPKVEVFAECVAWFGMRY